MRHFLKGFTLLEVLIAVLVVSLGLLGMVSLHVTTHLYNQSSLHRGQSAMLAREIVERMRVNVVDVVAGNYDGTYNSYSTSGTDCYKDAEETVDCGVADIRSHDLAVWSNRVAAMLPGGSGVIATDTSVDPVEVTVTLSWAGRRSAGMLSDAPVQKSQVFVFELNGPGG